MRCRREEIKNVWVASLNPDAMPSCAINSMYANILQNNRSQSGSQLSHQLQEARWLIKNGAATVRDDPARVAGDRRPSTHFFEHGEVGMRPTVLREIANNARPARIDRLARNDSEIHVYPARHFRAQYFFGVTSPPRRGRVFRPAIRALIKQLVPQRTPENLFRTARSRDPQASRDRGRTPHHRQVPESLQIPRSAMRKLFDRKTASHESHSSAGITWRYAVDPGLREGNSQIRRHFDHVIDVSVILSVDHLARQAEVSCLIAGKTSSPRATLLICTRRSTPWRTNSIARSSSTKTACNCASARMRSAPYPAD